MMSDHDPHPRKQGSPSPTTFGERLRAVRQAWGWTQEDLGQALHTDQTTISAWERDKVQPRGPALAAAAQLLSLPPEVLTAQTPVPFEPPPPPQRAPAATPPREWVRLPDDPPSAIGLIDLEAQGPEALVDTQEAILKLISAVRTGRKVWIVVR